MFSFSWSEWALLCNAALLGIVCVTPYTLELSRDALKADLVLHIIGDSIAKAMRAAEARVQG